jgi:hypothetical protein
MDRASAESKYGGDQFNRNSCGEKKMTFRTMLMVPVLSLLTVIPSFGCWRTPSLATVDEILSKHKLSGSSQTKASELRAKLEVALTQGNYREAFPLERQIMDIAGLQLLASRGGCGHWVPKTD